MKRKMLQQGGQQCGPDNQNSRKWGEGGFYAKVQNFSVTFGQKVNLSATFCMHSFSDKISFNTSWSVCLPNLNTDSWWWKKDSHKVLRQTLWSRSVKAAVRKRLMTANFSVLCQVGRLTYVFYYQFLMCFRFLGIFPIDRTCFLHHHNTRK